MRIYRVNLVYYIGFLCYFGNVLSDDIDLTNLDNSGFEIKNSYNNGCNYTDINQTSNKKITRIFNGNELIWEPENGEMCPGITFVNSPKSSNTLMYIEILKNGAYSIKYYVQNGGIYREVNQAAYNEGLRKLAEIPAFDQQFVAEVDKEIEQEYLEENSEVPSVAEHQDDLEDSVKEYETTEGLLNEETKSLRSEPQYQCDASQRNCTNKKRILDIVHPKENTRVIVDYEVNDGVFAMIANVKSNKKVTMVYENENLIWEGKDSQKLIMLSSHAFDGEYRLVELFYRSGDDAIAKYFGKPSDSWKEITENAFEQVYMDLKSNIPFKENISIDISNVTNSDLFYEKYETNIKFQAHTYFPLAGYHLNEVVDGLIPIWKSDSRRCVSAIVIRENQNIRFLKLEIYTSDDKLKKRFYIKESDEYAKIEESEFERLINDTTSKTSRKNSEENSSKTMDLEEVNRLLEQARKEERAKLDEKNRMDEEAKQHRINLEEKAKKEREDLEEKSRLERERLDEQARQERERLNEEARLEREKLNEQAKREIENARQAMENNNFQTSQSQPKPEQPQPSSNMIPLDINNHDPSLVFEDTHRGIIYRTFITPHGKNFNIIRIGNKIIWEAEKGQFSSFVRIFFPNTQPKLGFFKLTENAIESDIYIAEDNSNWIFINLDQFRARFEQFVRDKDHMPPVSSVPNKEDINSPQRQCNKIEIQPQNQASPLNFFIFDINHQNSGRN